MIFFVLVVILLFLGLVYEQLSRKIDAKSPKTGKMIDVGDYSMHVTDCGQGEATIVLIHGAGDSSYSWIHIRKELTKFSRVISYDRVGMGSSDLGPAPTPHHTVQELNNLLSKTGNPGPYILVGHSLGGIIARLYALEYPNKVAGFVFLDSTHEFLKDDTKFKQGFAAIGVMLKILRGLSPFGIPRFLGNITGMIPMFAHERKYYQQQLPPEEYKQWKGIVYRTFAGSAAGVEFKEAIAHLEEAARRLKNSKTIPQFGDLPIAVVNNPGFGAHWTEIQRELASRSTNNIHKTSDRKGHSLQMPRPELVVEAVQHVVEQVRSRNGRTLAESTLEQKIEVTVASD
ncbi:alpha/beta hydrolase [Paenisporosarcina quisquiliarum]|uniref:Alpha/beta hydrolase n=1 Tax=Paenisporosarcina quisquiliarum TaxID=365346 RepID=A0A9X3RFD6_9BACL|nr:alpha/beta hydrolase [Paenisporosarcina quisquiliarum]MCZ8538368.1 alpha/beta hydrolase [Paenisporosarcina quisquiliarum]